ncbi:uncharacterized protein YecT (DUF1311 family) [Endobacter medicaginis]|uniref:DUF1311 domain-containing protein n=1 Tax=Endobacter medicaginis TaxID=1181271 RepID=A0A850NJF6_9PROT|nr:lysozyme inhibitor LprI family protein [Endobacter medicaginis]MBB3172380.1 uncharacterized protein YecT (DUF1311 family) [Endobacter medicaginis]MCX5474130.1 lysozyme inhibitor LprI family protein [Endobacter medicaginis]NVN29044.1 DUF1311 domain-containing protein [Endobacter medicaginis]
MAALLGEPAIASAQAASFDCAKATSPREYLICGTAELSTLDQQLQATYAAKLVLLSPAGMKLLRASERAWFTYSDRICGFEAPQGVVPGAPKAQAQCLIEATHDRLRDLACIGRSGPYMIVRIDRYAARLVTGSDVAAHFSTRHVSIPQIDAPGSAAQQGWNRNVIEQMHQTGPSVDKVDMQDDVFGEIGLATPRLISLRWVDAFHDADMIHWQWTYRVSNMVMDPDLRAMVPSDLFAVTADWPRPLSDIAVRAIEAEGWVPDSESSLTGLRRLSGDPETWFLRTDGIEISLGSSSIGCRVCNPANSLVPWTKLRALMTPRALVR